MVKPQPFANELQDLNLLLDPLLIETRWLARADGGSNFLVEDGVLKFSDVQNDILFQADFLSITRISEHPSYGRMTIRDVTKARRLTQLCRQPETERERWARAEGTRGEGGWDSVGLDKKGAP